MDKAPLQQGTCLGMQGPVTWEWLWLGSRRALNVPFKTMPVLSVSFKLLVLFIKIAFVVG